MSDRSVVSSACGDIIDAYDNRPLRHNPLEQPVQHEAAGAAARQQRQRAGEQYRLERLDPSKISALAGAIKRAGVWNCPTQRVYEFYALNPRALSYGLSRKEMLGLRSQLRQTRKGQQWYFGLKLHIGTDPRGVVHHITTTDTATADITQLPALLHGQEWDLYGDQAYWKEEDRQHWQRAGGRYRVNRRGTKTRPLTAYQKALNRTRSRHRARGEHPFHVIKRSCGGQLHSNTTGSYLEDFSLGWQWGIRQWY